VRKRLSGYGLPTEFSAVPAYNPEPPSYVPVQQRASCAPRGLPKTPGAIPTARTAAQTGGLEQPVRRAPERGWNARSRPINDEGIELEAVLAAARPGSVVTSNGAPYCSRNSARAVVVLRYSAMSVRPVTVGSV